MKGGRAVVGAVAVAVLSACGGGSTAAPSKASWTAAHGPALDALDADLQAARTTLSSLQRPDILGTCNALRDSLGEARKGLPVPDPTADTALRNALDAVGTGTEDCFQGARGPNIPQLEKSFSELREADTLLDLARRTIDAWTSVEHADFHGGTLALRGERGRSDDGAGSSAFRTGGGAVAGGNGVLERG
jgi:hypothetical protein